MTLSRIYCMPDEQCTLICFSYLLFPMHFFSKKHFWFGFGGACRRYLNPPSPLSERWDWLGPVSHVDTYQILCFWTLLYTVHPSTHKSHVQGSRRFLPYIFWCTTSVFVLLAIGCRRGSLEAKSFEDSCQITTVFFRFSFLFILRFELFDADRGRRV